MPGDFRCDLTNACALSHTHCTRGYRAHRAPGIPCALGSEGKEISIKPRAYQAARSRTHTLSSLRGALATKQSRFLICGAKAGIFAALAITTTLIRQGRACPGHPRLSCFGAAKTWMPGTRPGLTSSLKGAFHGWREISHPAIATTLGKSAPT